MLIIPSLANRQRSSRGKMLCCSNAVRNLAFSKQPSDINLCKVVTTDSTSPYKILLKFSYAIYTFCLLFLVLSCSPSTLFPSFLAEPIKLMGQKYISTSLYYPTWGPFPAIQSLNNWIFLGNSKFISHNFILIIPKFSSSFAFQLTFQVGSWLPHTLNNPFRVCIVECYKLPMEDKHTIFRTRFPMGDSVIFGTLHHTGHLKTNFIYTSAWMTFVTFRSAQMMCDHVLQQLPWKVPTSSARLLLARGSSVCPN